MAAPANDLWVNAATCAAVDGTTVSSDTTESTVETDEPQPFPDFPNVDRSVWWKITPTSAAHLTVGSNSATLDALAIYTGTTLAGLSLVTATDTSAAGFSYSVEWDAAAGTTYWVQAGGFFGDEGPIELTLSAPGAGPVASPRVGRVRIGSGENHSVYAVSAVPPHLASEPIRIMAQQFPTPTLNERGQPS